MLIGGKIPVLGCVATLDWLTQGCTRHLSSPSQTRLVPGSAWRWIEGRVSLASARAVVPDSLSASPFVSHTSTECRRPAWLFWLRFRTELRCKLRRLPVRAGPWMPALVSQRSPGGTSYPSLSCASPICRPAFSRAALFTTSTKKTGAAGTRSEIQGFPRPRCTDTLSCRSFFSRVRGYMGQAVVGYGCTHGLQLAAAGNLQFLLETAHPTHLFPVARLRATALRGASAPSLTIHTRPHNAICACLVLSMDPSFAWLPCPARADAKRSVRAVLADPPLESQSHLAHVCMSALVESGWRSCSRSIVPAFLCVPPRRTKRYGGTGAFRFLTVSLALLVFFSTYTHATRRAAMPPHPCLLWCPVQVPTASLLIVPTPGRGASWGFPHSPLVLPGLTSSWLAIVSIPTCGVNCGITSSGASNVPIPCMSTLPAHTVQAI